MTTARPTATNGTDKPSGPRSRKGIETRARLVDAAKEVFERDGFLDARISDIAERAGLSHGSFYHYFESKEEVFREVAANVEARLYEPMNSVILDPVVRPARPSASARPSGCTWRATATRRASWASSSRCPASTPRSWPSVPSATGSTTTRWPAPFAACSAMAWPMPGSIPTLPPPRSVP